MSTRSLASRWMPDKRSPPVRDPDTRGRRGSEVVGVEGVDAESCDNKAIPPAERAKRHMQYDQYLLTEVLSFTARLNSNPFVITTGASLGAYHAVNFAFRYPHQVGRVIGMSGYYDITRWTDGS